MIVAHISDLTESGTLEEYRRLREILDASEIPVYLLAGNHDRREMLRAVFEDHATCTRRRSRFNTR